MGLFVRLSDGRHGVVSLAEGKTATELQDFLQGRGAFAEIGDWIPMHTGEWVQREHIVSVVVMRSPVAGVAEPPPAQPAR